MNCFCQDWPDDLKDVSFLFLLQHLSISNGNIQVDASFMQTLWNVHPTCSGSSIEEGVLLFVHSTLSLPVCPVLRILTFSATSQLLPECPGTQRDFGSPEFLSLMLVWMVFCPDF